MAISFRREYRSESGHVSAIDGQYIGLVKIRADHIDDFEAIRNFDGVRNCDLLARRRIPDE